MKRIFALATALLMAISVAPAQSDQLAELVKLEDPLSGGWIGVDFVENDYFGTSLLTVGNRKTESNYDSWDTILCDSVADPKCQVADYFFDATSIFSPCTATILTNCIESLNATLPDGTTVKGTVKRLWNPQGEFKGDPLLGIPDGGQASTWVLAGTNTANSDEYLLMAGVKGGVPVPTMTTQNNQESKFFGQLFAYLQPVKEIAGKYEDPKMRLVPRGSGGVGIGGGLTW